MLSTTEVFPFLGTSELRKRFTSFSEKKILEKLVDIQIKSTDPSILFMQENVNLAFLSVVIKHGKFTKILSFLLHENYTYAALWFFKIMMVYAVIAVEKVQ